MYIFLNSSHEVTGYNLVHFQIAFFLSCCAVQCAYCAQRITKVGGRVFEKLKPGQLFFSLETFWILLKPGPFTKNILHDMSVC